MSHIFVPAQALDSATRRKQVPLCWLSLDLASLQSCPAIIYELRWASHAYTGIITKLAATVSNPLPSWKVYKLHPFDHAIASIQAFKLNIANSPQMQ